MNPQISQMAQMEKRFERQTGGGSEMGEDYPLYANAIRDQSGFLYNRNFKWYGFNIFWSVLFEIVPRGLPGRCCTLRKTIVKEEGGQLRQKNKVEQNKTSSILTTNKFSSPFSKGGGTL